MTETIRIVVIGDDAIRNALMSTVDGGAHLTLGLTEIVAEQYKDRTIDMSFIHGESISTSLANLQDEDTDHPVGLVDSDCDVVIIATTHDVRSLNDLADEPLQAIKAFSDSLVEMIDLIKERTGAHVLVANTATFDPESTPSSLFGLDDEPVSLRAHRVDLVLLKLSHLLGISLIDIDRVTAEAGASGVIPVALELNREGSKLVRDETVRVLADYGFFDDRQLAPQVGNRKKSA